MDLNSFVGKEITQVKNMLEESGINIIVKDNNSGSREFDTELVVRIKKLDNNLVEIITSKFKLNL